MSDKYHIEQRLVNEEWLSNPINARLFCKSISVITDYPGIENPEASIMNIGHVIFYNDFSFSVHDENEMILYSGDNLKEFTDETLDRYIGLGWTDSIGD